jgi:hypothetical protein
MVDRRAKTNYLHFLSSTPLHGMKMVDHVENTEKRASMTLSVK